VFDRITEIRENADYNNFRVFFNAKFGKVNNPMKLDITTGDEITPSAVEYVYKTMFEEDSIGIKAYNLLTILAEKYETIIRLNIGNTRARDFYDLYVLYKLNREEIDFHMLSEAVRRTANNRNSFDDMLDAKEIISEISSEESLMKLWKDYQEEYSYSRDIEYEDLMGCIAEISERLTLN